MTRDRLNARSPDVSVRARTLAAAVPVMFLGACVTENPRHQIPQPPNVAATAVQVFAAAPRDTNGNGYVDTVGITVFIFDQERAVVPIAVPGTFTFRMTKPDGTPMFEWAMTEDETRRALQGMPPGPGFLFDLCILSKGKDTLDFQAVDLTAEFIPKDGNPVRSAGGASLRLGRVSQ